MKVRWSKTALIEFEEIFLYISERNEAAARAVVARIERVCTQLEQFPFTGVATSEDEARMLPIVRYPFSIFYAVDEGLDEVVILHVRHTARRKPATDDPVAG
ncbi:type II toxin-antitoxin system RelE/ParE family toxin [Tardiphaga sp. 285_C5_N1_2]|uniref:type II toxin-antitoxin system RelE/ParE family toxin n=1 Tax=Tardiphaga sp. 285_C5_N1_2 TaxID=3240775 RepID=UPI003F8C5B57